MKSIPGFVWSLIAMVLCVVLGIATLGILGALVFAAGLPAAVLVYGMDITDKLPADSMWPIALYLTMLWPLVFPVAYLIATRIWRGPARLKKIGTFVFVLWLWADALAVWACSSVQ